MHSTPCPSSCACTLCDACGAHSDDLAVVDTTYGGALWRECRSCRFSTVQRYAALAALVNRALLVGPRMAGKVAA